LLGNAEGEEDGSLLGTKVGSLLGICEGNFDGRLLGFTVGMEEGLLDGIVEGSLEIPTANPAEVSIIPTMTPPTIFADRHCSGLEDKAMKPTRDNRFFIFFIVASLWSRYVLSILERKVVGDRR